jgi:hypothetical protein
MSKAAFVDYERSNTSSLMCKAFGSAKRWIEDHESSQHHTIDALRRRSGVREQLGKVLVIDAPRLHVDSCCQHLLQLLLREFLAVAADEA